MQCQPAHRHAEIDLNTGMKETVGSDEKIHTEGAFVESGWEGGELCCESGDEGEGVRREDS